MKTFSFSEDSALKPKDLLLEGVSISPLTSSMAAGADFQAAIFRLVPGGAIRRHPASTHQIIAVLAGSGEVSGDDGAFIKVEEGNGVFFSTGEEHETRTEEGMTALILEGDGLQPLGADKA